MLAMKMVLIVMSMAVVMRMVVVRAIIMLVRVYFAAVVLKFMGVQSSRVVEVVMMLDGL